MTIKSNPCSHCGSTYHSRAFCDKLPRKAIKRTAIKPTVKKSLTVQKSKKSQRAIAKDNAWKAFSAYIRTRDCIRFTGDKEQGMCVTCKAKKPYKELQAGHFVGGRGNAVLFNEQIVYSQCSYCNQKPPIGLGGNYAAYTLFMFDEGYNREEIERFLQLRHQTKVYKIHDFQSIREEYIQKSIALS